MRSKMENLFTMLYVEQKLYIPSILKTDFIFWHPQWILKALLRMNVLNDVTAVPFSVSFSQLPTSNKNIDVKVIKHHSVTYAPKHKSHKKLEFTDIAASGLAV